MDNEEAITSLTLALFYLTAWEEEGYSENSTVHRAWKSADWNVLDYLRDRELVYCSNRAKSVTITESGVTRAREILASLGLGHLA